MAGRITTGLMLAASLALASCSGWSDKGQPPRTDDRIVVQPQPSLVTVPVEAELGDLARAMERNVPRQLWRINQRDQICVASKGVDLGIATVKTPKIKCNIVGEVTRGSIRVGGTGKELRFSFPLTAVIRAEDIGGILKRETATAKAMAHAVVRLELEKDWSPRGTVKLSYDWLTEPHVDFMGQKIRLTEPAERELAPIIAKLERELPGELGKIGIRRQIGQAWASAFTSVVLNERNPPVWMRITPRELQYGGYEVANGRLRLRLGMRALTETYVGKRPRPRPATALPPMVPLAGTPGELAFFLPVFAEYGELEPVLIRALRKRSRRPFMVPGLEPVDATFKAATIYGTTGGRIAVGLTFTAHERGSRTPTSGTVWMTGKPANAEDSRRVGFTDFGVTGTTDMTGGDLILDMMNAPGVAPMIAELLAQNFERDYAELLGKVDQAIAAKRSGDIVIHADLKRARTGQLQAAGAGLYLPVWASGTASVTIAP
ncbi:DUF4403 family protein [Blastomonas fulva]|uniref:DUF4403 family protein n=1 Tax=Blastomonas fulva TaxID=1550728 RepID=UPI0025A39C70|nr:DUF4403 family protein [Blastomonas fulva]MDM7927995.1 DUF4403 family protein [Blastomonas fulva]MDM7966568.1 DUF4403 family protein [Blastomonas fulva]